MSEFRLSTTSEYLSWAFEDNGTVELRHQNGGLWFTGWFSDRDALLHEARRRHARGNLYTSLNAPRPRVVRNTMSGTPLRDDEVAFVTRLPFDFDPARPTGTCSTDAELALALERRDGLVAMLHKLGWPWPLHAKSGNGHHALYRVRLPNNAETREMLGHLYLGLHRELDDDLVAFDRSVRNPGRIFRLYGSTNRKGPDTQDRPHRQSTVWIPPEWRQVKASQIRELASYYARQAPPQTERAPGAPHLAGLRGRGDYSTLDVVAWFTAHGLYRQAIGSKVHSALCPWRHEHTSPGSRSSTVIFEATDGWPGFHCHHAHCAGRTIRDVMQILGDADAFCAVEYQGGRTS